MSDVTPIRPQLPDSTAARKLMDDLNRARRHILRNADRTAAVIVTVVRDDGTSYSEVAGNVSPLVLIGALHRAIMDQY